MNTPVRWMATRWLNEPDGTLIEVSIGQPYVDALERWHCPFRYIREGTVTSKSAPGGDGFQALINALGTMSRDWHGKATWAGLDHPGFPIIVDGEPALVDYNKIRALIDEALK